MILTTANEKKLYEEELFTGSDLLRVYLGSQGFKNNGNNTFLIAMMNGKSISKGYGIKPPKMNLLRSPILVVIKLIEAA